MDHVTIESLTGRLERLEGECRESRRQARRWKRAGAFAVLGLVVLAVGGARRADDPGIVEARQILLRDESGSVRARIETGPHGQASLVLLDGEARTRIGMTVGRDGQASMDFFDFDTGGVPLKPITIRIAKSGNPYVVLESRDGTKKAVFP